MFLQAANDYSLTPSQAMADELSRLSKTNVRKLYPPIGETASDAHNFLYTDVTVWSKTYLHFSVLMSGVKSPQSGSPVLLSSSREWKSRRCRRKIAISLAGPAAGILSAKA